jgi:hypothetical protein
MASLHGGNLGDLQERRISALQLRSYEAIRAATREGAALDFNADAGLVAPGEAGVQVRNNSFRTVARLTRDKPSLADVADGHRQVAQVTRAASPELKAYDE